jgi:hypothetical protein
MVSAAAAAAVDTTQFEAALDFTSVRSGLLRGRLKVSIRTGVLDLRCRGSRRALRRRPSDRLPDRLELGFRPRRRCSRWSRCG